VDLTRVQGTGFKQRILKEDVQAFVKTKLAQGGEGGGSGLAIAPPPVVDFAKFGTVEVQALSRIKKLSGKFLHRNWVSIPHVTQFGEADITDLEAYRQKNKARFEKEGLKLTPLVFIMKAVVDSLKKFPTFNASLDASGENLVLKHYFHIGVAVDTPDGLVVPVVRDVNKKRVSALAKELAVFSEKARAKQLLPNDMQGGCFSISSLGGIGGTAFTPIINAPEVAILGVSKVSQKPVYKDGVLVPRLMLPLSLSYDHRVIDGAEAARFIVYLSELLSDVRNLLL
jgi:pyruvate dehydrogenase E2 component (dihydrolipoamide acetyltransferase)